MQKARQEAEDLRKQVATLQKQFEEETIQRVDLTNRIQSLKEELNLRQAVHDKVARTSHHYFSYCFILSNFKLIQSCWKHNSVYNS